MDLDARDFETLEASDLEFDQLEHLGVESSDLEFCWGEAEITELSREETLGDRLAKRCNYGDQSDQQHNCDDRDPAESSRRGGPFVDQWCIVARASRDSPDDHRESSYRPSGDRGRNGLSSRGGRGRNGLSSRGGRGRNGCSNRGGRESDCRANLGLGESSRRVCYRDGSCIDCDGDIGNRDGIDGGCRTRGSDS